MRGRGKRVDEHGEGDGETGEPAEHEPDRRLARGRPDHGPDDEAEDGGAVGGPEGLAAPLAGRGDRDPGETARPGDDAGHALHEPGETERYRVAREGERQRGDRERDEPRRDCDARTHALDEQPGRDAGEERSGAERAEQEPRRGLVEIHLVPKSGEEGDEGAEQGGVHEEHDREDEAELPHRTNRPSNRRCPGGADGVTRRNAASRWPPRPVSRLISAEVITRQEPIDLRCSVLAARGR